MLHTIGRTVLAQLQNLLHGFLQLTFRTLFRPSDAIFEEPRVESGAGAIYRPFHAL